jgi:mannose-6-phosphate isomerase-like protein (cupin superfamily)
MSANVLHFHMVKDRTRRSFLRSAPLAAAAVSLPFADGALFAEVVTPEPFQLFTAEKLADSKKKVQATPGNDNLFANAALPLTIVMTTEEKKAGKEFEYHENRDHIFQILEGTTSYEMGGTPQNARNTKPGEWLAPASQGAATVTLHKGDMLVIPRGTPHKRTTESSVTFILISAEGAKKA